MKEITITGCNNCPFRPMEYDLGDCNLFIHLFPNELDSHIKIYDLANEYRADIPGRARLGLLPGGVDDAEISFKGDLTFGSTTDAALVQDEEFLRITSDGNVGIGATAPTHTLEVGQGGGELGTYFQAFGSNGYDFTLYSYPQDANIFRVNGDDNYITFDENNAGWKVGIGVSNPNVKLYVNGDFRLTDGSQGSGKFLESDANGIASWKTLTSGDISNFSTASRNEMSGLNTYTTPALAQVALGSGKPYILNTTIGIVSVLLLAITP